MVYQGTEKWSHRQARGTCREKEEDPAATATLLRVSERRAERRALCVSHSGSRSLPEVGRKEKSKDKYVDTSVGGSCQYPVSLA